MRVLDHADGVREPFLHDVRRIDPTANPAIEPGFDHSSQARPVPDQRLTDGSRVARAGPFNEPLILVGFIHDDATQALTV